MPVASADKADGLVKPTKKGKAPTITPTMDHVLIKADKSAEMSEGRDGTPIHLPEKYREQKGGKLRIGTILAVGPGMYKHGVLVEMSRKSGERVYFTPRGGYTTEHFGEELHLVAEELIIGVIGEA